MAETHVISALTDKRSELAGLIAHHRKEITDEDDWLLLFKLVGKESRDDGEKITACRHEAFGDAHERLVEPKDRRVIDWQDGRKRVLADAAEET